MMRVGLRRVGHLTGKVAAVPDSLLALLELATKKLQLDAPAARIFLVRGSPSASPTSAR